MELCFTAWAVIVGAGCLFLFLRWLAKATKRTAAAAWRLTPLSEQARRQRRSRALQRASASAHHRQLVTTNTDKNTARAQFMAFYTENQFVLMDAFPPAMCVAFLRLELAEQLDAETIWKNVREQVARLQPIVIQEREKLRAARMKRSEEQHRSRQEEEQRKRVAGRRKLNPDDV